MLQKALVGRLGGASWLTNLKKKNKQKTVAALQQ